MRGQDKRFGFKYLFLLWLWRCCQTNANQSLQGYSPEPADRGELREGPGFDPKRAFALAQQVGSNADKVAVHHTPICGANGPKPTLPGQRDAAVQLPQSGHSSVLTL
jgi:hypothetical protein